jgi:acylglycerol lipase
MPWYQRFGIWLGARLMPGAGLSSRDYGLIASDNAEALAESASDPMTIHGTRFDTLEGLTDLMDEAMRALPRMRTRTLVVYGQRDV